MTKREVWALIVFLATGPITAVVYVLFAFGFTVHWALPEKLRPVWRYAYGLPFGLLDVAYNLTVGTMMFGEPKVEFFTARITRRRDKGCGLCSFLCDCLSVFDPGHCR